MDRLPDIEMPADEIKEDLAIIETEDLSADPFVRAPPIKPEAPKPQKPKRQVSEKQKAHLANARKLARERKQQKKLEQEKQKEEKKQDIKEYAKVIDSKPQNIQTDPGTATSQANKVDGFEQWLGYMDQYAGLMQKHNALERKKKEEAERKEKELEAKYFKKFQEQQKLNKIQNDLMEKEQPVKRIPKKHLDILAPPQNDYGEYSSYF